MSIPYTKHLTDEFDVKHVTDVLLNQNLTQGRQVPALEVELSDQLAPGASIVAVNSGTSALYVLYRALGIRRGSTVWTTAITFVATANVASMLGARVKFIDIDCKTFNISIAKLKEALEIASESGTLPDLIVWVHFGGNPTGFLEAIELARKFQVKLVADGSHACGSFCNNAPVASIKGCMATVFSFHPAKLITSAEGGCVVTYNSEIAEKMRELRDNGIQRECGPYEWSYDNVTYGLNLRMSDVHAALGRSQLLKLGRFNASRNAIARWYHESLPDFVRPQVIASNCSSARHLYTVSIDLLKSLSDKNVFFQYMHSNGIGVQNHYIPIYLFSNWKQESNSVNLITSDRYYEQSVSLPLYPDLEKKVVRRIVNMIEAFFDSSNSR